MVLLHNTTHVIPYFRPFHSISYCFQDKKIVGKNGKIANSGKFSKIIKFSKYGALTYYDPCDPKFWTVSLLSFTISEIRTFFPTKMAK